MIIPVCLLALFTAGGCTTYEELDVTQDYLRDSRSQKGYAVGATYELQRDLFVIKLERPHARFTEPGDMVPSIAAWDSGERKSDLVKILGLLRAGTKVRVERLVLIRIKHGISQVTPMMRAEGIELPINPFDVSELDHSYGGATLCKPDERFLRAVP